MVAQGALETRHYSRDITHIKMPCAAYNNKPTQCLKQTETGGSWCRIWPAKGSQYKFKRLRKLICRYELSEIADVNISALFLRAVSLNIGAALSDDKLPRKVLVDKRRTNRF